MPTDCPTTTACPACSHASHTPHAVDGVAVCDRCGAIFTLRPIYRGDSFAIVLPVWHRGAEGETRYFDLDVVGSNGPERRHGWFDVRTRRITQTG